MNYLKLALLVALALAATGCTALKQQTPAEADTTAASDEWRLKSLEESFLHFREAQRMQADQNAEQTEMIFEKLETLETELATLRGGAAVMDSPAAMMDKPSDEGWVTDLKPDEENWVDGQKPQETPMAESGEEKPWAEVPGPPTNIPDPTVVQRTPKPAPKQMAKAPRTPAVSGAQAMYNRAMGKYRADDYVGARGGFDEFLKRYPNSKLAPNALYWKGETFYGQKDYPQAILAFKEVTSQFPKHAKAADALLKIGMAYDRVSDPDNAVFYLRALVEDFPGSRAAGLARTELNRLGG